MNCTTVLSSEPTEKPTFYYSEESSKYAKISLLGEGTLYLSFRDLESVIRKHFPNQPLQDLKAIDYGCGAGRSTRYLKSLGIENVDGFDISQDMIKEAKELDPKTRYQLITSACLPVPDATYDMALMSFVTVAVDTKNEISQIFQELSRVLKKDSLLISLTLSETFWNPQRKWVSYKQDYPENYQPKSGQKSRLLLTSINLELTDSYWKNNDIIACAKKANLSLCNIHAPLGTDKDRIKWQDEYKFSPYTILSFKKD